MSHTFFHTLILPSGCFSRPYNFTPAHFSAVECLCTFIYLGEQAKILFVDDDPGSVLGEVPKKSTLLRSVPGKSVIMKKAYTYQNAILCK